MMEFKFIYCIDEDIANKLMDKLELINTQEINGKKTWIFENDNKIFKFSNEFDVDKLEFSNKMFI